ncbi:MAG: protein-ADP-ribose hydrolase [Candidatus Thiodiazotropha endolucinida]|uniref:Protein-ADP-ribose hydrolase n=1 Tax=Candidatus Thiodiazotropha taylori TaxID=2792791 RepID=A0A9E4TUS1_9GAMM|nr:protein-ADP-ribose hydrolase [Candidatus Thiodiazotropha taylori]MCW4238246.1 protein-ADP-ribose hydrolase [Candidatus Thiodiazotropha endolucinida]
MPETRDPLVEYAGKIELDTPFVPAPGPADVAAVVRAIEDDAGSWSFVQHHPQPVDPQEHRNWIRAALTVRLAGGLPQQLADGMDRLLQAELRGKDITDAAFLPRLTGAYPVADQVSIWNGDIVTLQIGAIANAANAQLLGCFQPFHACIDNAIHSAAGPRLREDCARIMELQGHDEPTGRVKITRAYNLPSGYVLHTVGPIVPDQHPTAQQAQELANCYAACLSLTAEMGIKSVALCGISTGVFGYPADQATEIALRTVANWFEQNPGGLDHVVFNTFGTAATELYQEAIRSWT